MSYIVSVYNTVNLNTYTAQNFKLPPLMRGSRFGGRGSRSGPPPSGNFINLRTVKLPKIGFRPPSHLWQTLISLGPPPPPEIFSWIRAWVVF